MEDEDEDQENEQEDERETVKSAKWRVEERSEQTLRMKHGDDVMRTTILSQCHVRH